MQLSGPVAERYRDFASYARGDSPVLEGWALGVAEDSALHTWLADLPEPKQQPNLVFAAARWHGATATTTYAQLRELLLTREDEVKATIRARATQTNEVGRLGTLAPVLGLLDGPLALIEVGASAGLCLFPDRYDYAWPPLGELRGSGGPVLATRAAGPVPVPTRAIPIAWRGGVDLHPLDVTDVDAMGWLETLIWPEQDERRTRLRAAIEVARAEPPTILTGDLFDHLPALIAEAGRHGTPVVMHSAVVAYLDDEARGRLHDLMTGLVAAGECRWVSNEAPRVLPRVTGDLAVPPGRFVIGLDGVPVAIAHGHGAELTWVD